MKKHILIFTFSLLALIILPFISISMGRFYISLNDVMRAIIGKSDDMVVNKIVFNLRLPRILTSILVGASLSCAGTAYQGVFKNPLVSPDLLGVSAGACVGAAISILLGLNYGYTILISFITGILCVGLTLTFSLCIKRKSNLILLLSGIIVGRFMDSILGGLKYFADSESQLGDIVYWQMGSVARVTMQRLQFISPIIFVSLFMMFALRWRINLLAVGERDAQSLGVNVVIERSVVILFSTLLTAASVSISGSIGWLGLIIPHITRWIIGTDNKNAIPLSMLFGALFLLIVDTLARTITPLELPLGVLIGIIGTPIFAVVLIRQREKTI